MTSYNTNHWAGSQCQLLGVVTAEDAVRRGLAESIGYYPDDEGRECRAAFAAPDAALERLVADDPDSICYVVVLVEDYEDDAE